MPRWVRPSRGLAKINVNTTMSKNSGQAVAATVARDEDGNYLGASVLVVAGQLPRGVCPASDCTNAVRSYWAKGSAVMDQLFGR